MTYTAPQKDMLFVMEHLAELDELAASVPEFADAGMDTARAVLDECARFNESVVAPLSREGDRQTSVWVDGHVRTPEGFAAAFQQFAAGGWMGLLHPVAYGGQGLPKTIGAATMEMVNSADLSFALCPLLTDGAIEALLTAGSAQQQATYIPRMIRGAWAGTMNLTEPQAGSDLALLRARAEPQPDGSYRVFGTKIFITYGEQDFTENIVHLVLARLPDAPAGVKGISLFIVPKWLSNDDGEPTARNDVQCVGLEHKLGIKASPTAVLQYGQGLKGSVADAQGPGAVGYLVGAPHRGLEYMFVMMNAARYAVGVQGLAVAERAYQKAVQYARERLQGRALTGGAEQGAVPIVQHPDVRRMLASMRAITEGCRALAGVAAGACDRAKHHPDAGMREAQQAWYEFLVPLVKGYCTEMCQEVTDWAVQVHGGMGFIEDTGIAQQYRDGRILTIYEGTTAIQANDFVGRKIVRDGGRVAHQLCAEVEATEAALRSRGTPAALAMAGRLEAARTAFVEVVEWVLQHHRSEPLAVYAGNVPFLLLSGHLVAGWQMARALLVAQTDRAMAQDPGFMQAKVATAQVFAQHMLTRVPGLREAVLHGHTGVLDVSVDAF